MNMIVKSNLKGIAFILVNVLAMSLNSVCLKKLTIDLSSNLVAFLYKFAVTVCVFPVVMWSGGVRTKVFHLHLMRGFFSAVGSLFFFYALKNISLTDATALGYLEQVILMLIGILFFREPPTKVKFFSILMCLLGAFFIIYKNYVYLDLDYALRVQEHFPIQNFTYYHFFVICAVLIWAGNRTLVKILGQSERTSLQLFYVSLFSTLISFPFAFFRMENTVLSGFEVPVPVGIQDWSHLGIRFDHLLWFLSLMLLYIIHSVSTFKALQYAELSVIVPFEYIRLILTAIMSYFIFQEQYSLGSYVGCALIILSGVLMIGSERRNIFKLKSQTPPQTTPSVSSNSHSSH